MKLFKISIPAIFAVILLTSYSYAGGVHTAKVLKAETGGGYTYMNVDENGNKFWIAGPETKLGKGTTVSFDEQMWMKDFQSKALNRKFDSIMFVGAIKSASASSGVKTAKAKTTKPAATKMVDHSKTLPAGPAVQYTIKELFEKKDQLNGKLIKVKGTVTKVSRGILKMDWVHVQDGTKFLGNNKIVFTTQDRTIEVDDEVTAQGTFVTDKDFGAGYFYSVIIMESSFSK